MTEYQKCELLMALQTLEKYNTELSQSDAEEMPREDFEIIKKLRDTADNLIDDFAPFMY